MYEITKETMDELYKYSLRKNLVFHTTPLFYDENDWHGNIFIENNYATKQDILRLFIEKYVERCETEDAPVTCILSSYFRKSIIPLIYKQIQDHAFPTDLPCTFVCMIIPQNNILTINYYADDYTVSIDYNGLPISIEQYLKVVNMFMKDKFFYNIARELLHEAEIDIEPFDENKENEDEKEE
jgi:hypothetical protein